MSKETDKTISAQGVPQGSAESTLASLPEQNTLTTHAKRGVPLLFAVLESVCVFLIGLSKMGILVGVSSLLAAEKASSFHSEKFRIPILLVAVIGSVVNLYSVWNFHRLRNAASAAWRRRPLSGGRKAKDAVLVVLSVAALVLVAAELYFHPLFGK